MRRNFLKYAKFIIVTSIVTSLFIAYKIAGEYAVSAGKERAYFWTTDVIDYRFQYLVSILGLIAIVLIVFHRDKNSKRTQIIWVTLLAFFSIILVFCKIWRFLVWMH